MQERVTELHMSGTCFTLVLNSAPFPVIAARVGQGIGSVFTAVPRRGLAKQGHGGM